MTTYPGKATLDVQDRSILLYFYAYTYPNIRRKVMSRREQIGSTVTPQPFIGRHSIQKFQPHHLMPLPTKQPLDALYVLQSESRTVVDQGVGRRWRLDII